ncbi:MAG: hypothetical protein AAB932_04500 [Patescibacteria group bacterium]
MGKGKKRVLVIAPESVGQICRYALESLGCTVVLKNTWPENLPMQLVVSRPFTAILVAARVEGSASGENVVDLVVKLHARFMAGVPRLPPIFILADSATDEVWQRAHALKIDKKVRFVFLTPFPHPPAAMRMVLDRS